MTFCLPTVIDDDELPPAVLQALALDGELYRIGDAYRVVDLPVFAESRANALRAHCRQGQVLAGHSAAWVWGVVARQPERHETILPAGTPVGHLSSATCPDLSARTRRLGAQDVVRFGLVGVTSLRRTAIDLLCGRELSLAQDELAELVRLADPGPRTLRAELVSRRRLGGRGIALARLQLLVTR